MNENIIDSGIISIDNYEILFSSTLLNYEHENNSVVQYLNNAQVKNLDIDLAPKINWKDEEKTSISSISFLMPSDEYKLSDVFDATPYGLIKKNRTGVGATTLELKSRRNSIIVVPTKTLAYNKARQSKIAGAGDAYMVLYVGSNIVGFSVPEIEEYLADDTIVDKKFIVVADSLPKLLEKIGKEYYKDYFLMVDEVDSYQYDGQYREALEDVIDYYFEFPSTQRCLVSATIGSFSNKKIEEEPVIDVTFNQPQPRDINLLHTNNVIATTVRQINAIIERDPDAKILIAYNSLRRGILQIIESLNEELKSRCAILCSSSTQSKTYAGEYYADIIEENLPNQITFMTCTYFVGIDISERFHLISVAEGLKNQLHTLLSEDKLEQIAGRCRHEEGLLSETVIYQSRGELVGTEHLLYPSTPEAVELEIKEDAQILIDYINTIPKLKEVYKGLNNWLNGIKIDAIIHNSFKSYYSSSSVRLLREDIYNEVKPAYLNIDNILIQYNILNSLYLLEEALKESLQNQGHIVTWENVEESEERVSSQVQDNLDEYIRNIEEDEIDNIVEQLRIGSSIEERTRLATSYKIDLNPTPKGIVFIDRFLELQSYVPFEALITRLSQLNTPSEYNKFYNSVIFWALSEEHSFKIAFKERFPLEFPLPSRDIMTRLNDLLESNLGYSIVSTNAAIRNLKVFGIIRRVRHRIEGNPYKIISYDVNNFGTPLNTIGASANIKEFFKF